MIVRVLLGVFEASVAPSLANGKALHEVRGDWLRDKVSDVEDGSYIVVLVPFQVASLMIVRVLLGVFEASVAPSLILITGMWWTKPEPNILANGKALHEVRGDWLRDKVSDVEDGSYIVVLPLVKAMPL
jgi:hypothetical protein